MIRRGFHAAHQLDEQRGWLLLSALEFELHRSGGGWHGESESCCGWVTVLWKGLDCVGLDRGSRVVWWWNRSIGPLAQADGDLVLAGR